MSDILMMIGAGMMQTPAIETAKRAGYRVAAVDGNANAIGKELADFFIHADIASWEDVLIESKKFHKNKACIGGVITIGTDFSYTVAKVAEAIGLVGVSPDTALGATNKSIMRRRFRENNVPCPDFGTAKNIDEAKDLLLHLGCPCVIKPVDNMGARGVRMIRSADELDLCFKKALEYSKNHEVIIEQFMEGPELSVDTIVYNNKVHLLTVADRIISGEPYFIERGHTIPSALPDNTLQEVFNVMKMGIKALGINVGASKADMKVTPKGPMIGEMTARLSGGFHSQYTDPLATGMNSMKAAIDIAMGKSLDESDITQRFKRAACERSLYPDPGKVVEILGVEEAKKMEKIEKIFLNASVGDHLFPIISNMGKAAHIIASGETRQEAIEACEKAMQKIIIKTVAS